MVGYLSLFLLFKIQIGNLYSWNFNGKYSENINILNNNKTIKINRLFLNDILKGFIAIAIYFVWSLI